MEDTRKLLLRFRRGVKGLQLRRFLKLVWRSRPPFRSVDYRMKYEPPETLKVTAGPAEEDWFRRFRSESSPWTLHGGESKHYKSMEEWPTLQEAMRTPISVPPPTFPGVSLLPDIMIYVGTVNIGIAQGYGTAYKLLKEQLNLETSSSSQKSEIPDHVSIHERDDFILKLPVSSITDHDGYIPMLPVQGSTRMGTPYPRIQQQHQQQPKIRDPSSSIPWQLFHEEEPPISEELS